MSAATNIANLALIEIADDADHPPEDGDVLTWVDADEKVRAKPPSVRLAGGNTFTGTQAVTPVALADAATIDTDASLGNTFTVTLGGNRTLANPTNMVNGAYYTWVIVQDGAGGRTLDYGSKFAFPGGTEPTVTATANAVDMISALYNSALDLLLCVHQADFEVPA